MLSNIIIFVALMYTFGPLIGALMGALIVAYFQDW